MKNTEKMELNIEQLDKVTGGTKLQEIALRVIFLGKDLLDDSPISFGDVFYTRSYVTFRTGFIVRNGEVNSEGETELVYESPDGIIYSHDDFMDYLRANYTLEYLSGGKWKD